MTIAVDGNPQQYTGNATDAVLNTVFKFFTATDIVVTSRVITTGVPTVLVKDTHYSVSGGSTAGATGTVTAINGSSNFPTTVTWTIERRLALTQPTDYIANDNFPAESHEIALDRLTLIVQDLKAIVDDRCIKFPLTDAIGLTTELPNSVDRASETCKFDSSGNVETS